MLSLGLGMGLTRRHGGATDYDYSSASQPLLWWMDPQRLNGSTATTGTDGDLVPTWGNRMGAGYPYVAQATSTLQPKLVQHNGKWAVRDDDAAISTTSSGGPGVRRGKFVDSAGSPLIVDLRDTHNFFMVRLGGSTPLGNRFIAGLENTSNNLQIGTNGGDLTITGTLAAGGQPWDRELATTTALAGSTWYLVEAILRAGTAQSSLWLHTGLTPSASPLSVTTTANQTVGVFADTLFSSNVNATYFGLGGAIGLWLTYDITAGLLADPVAVRTAALAQMAEFAP
jgi:hypothetical protein